MLLNLRAWWHERQGHLNAALSDLELAHSLAPDDAHVLNALGLCLERLSRSRESFDAFDRATKLDPRFVAAHLNRGRLAQALGDQDAARRSFLDALRLGYNAHGDLAELAARRGDWTEARLQAAQALAINPGLASAEHVLAQAETAQGDCATASARLSRLLAAESLSPADRATTLCLLGDARDGQGCFPEAFTAYEAGNEGLRQIYAPRFASPGVETMSQYVEKLTRHFQHLPRGNWIDVGADATGNEGAPRRHVFLLGFARSGTTLVEEALACDPDVVTTQETDGLADAVSGLLKDKAALDRLAVLRSAGLVRYRRAYWHRLAEHGIAAPKTGCLVDKQPYNTIALPLVAKLFPAAKILFCYRDPRDVVLSCFRRRFAMNATNFQLLTLAGAAKFYDAVMRLAGIYRANFPVEIMEVRHERLVENFTDVMAEICAFTGISWQEGMQDFAARVHRRGIVTPNATQLSRGLNREGVGHWRHYRAELEPVMPILRPWIEHFGYEAE